MVTVDAGFPDDLIGKGGFLLDGTDLSFPVGIDSCFFASTQIYSLVFLRWLKNPEEFGADPETQRG